MDYKERIEEKRQKLVNTLIEFIENNPTQWEAGWYKVATVPPFNGKSEKAYKGLNALYLCVLSMIKGYRDPRWVSFNQAKELGGNVKSGEKSSEIFYWSFYDKATKKTYEEKTCEDMTKKERLEYWEKNVRPVIKFYQVFNAEQCENLPEYKSETTPEMEAEERKRQNAVIEQVIANSDATVNYDGGNRAYYSPAEDSIHLPAIKDFKTMQDYYATALHEIAHSTGHESRLNRNLLGFFGTADYAKEELRAELASVFMQVEYGISIEGKHFENHGAYLAGWLRSVKDNKNDFFAAATDAERITNYIADNYLKNIKEPKFDANNSFAKQVDALLSGANTDSTHLKIMGTPLLLRQLGAQNIPILIKANHLKNIIAESGNKKYVNYHGVDVDIIKKLPELLSDPVMVMDSLTRDDSVVIVTSAVNKENRPILGAIRFDGFGRQDGKIIEANILASVYGKDNFENFIRRNVKAENVLYWSKEKSQDLSVNPGFQLPDVLASLNSNTILRKAKAFVNSLDEKKENIPVAEAKKAEKSTADMLERESSAKAIYLDYVKTQKENPEAIVLKRIGDFYEVMGDKAAQVAATLDLTLTGRDVGLSDRVAMCGFPYHVADEYIERLRESSDIIVNNKYLVKRSLAEQVDTVEQARQVGQVGQVGLVKIELSAENKLKEYGKATMFRIPKGLEFSSFVFLAPTKFVGITDKGVTLSAPADFEFTLQNDGREVKLTGEELRANFAGQKTGKSAQRGPAAKRNAARLDALRTNAPAEMREMPNWCVFKTKWNDKKGKKDKYILSPIDGKWARSNAPENWTDFETAYKYAVENNCEGLAFALDNSGIACIDLDKCIIDGKMNGIADQLSGELKDTYCEKSVSGNGLHFFVKDDILGDKYRNRADTPQGELEVYQTGRFISMTGNVVGATTKLSKCPTATISHLRKTLGTKIQENVGPRSTSSSNGATSLRYQSDAEVIERIRRSKKGNTFDTLYSGGSITGDKSRDDLAMLNTLAFFTDCNESQMRSIFESSARFRPDTKNAAYLDRSIKKACQSLNIRLGEHQNGAQSRREK